MSISQRQFSQMHVEEGAAFVRDVPIGETIIVENDLDENVYILQSGALQVTAGGHFIARLEAVEIFGEMAIFNGARRSASVATTAPSTVLCFSKAHFIRLLDGNERFSDFVFRTLANRTGESRRRLVKQLDERIREVKAEAASPFEKDGAFHRWKTD